MRLFSEKFVFHAHNFLMTFFPTISEKNSLLMTPFVTLFILSRPSDNTISQNIRGTDAWAVPLPQIFVPSRSPPLDSAMMITDFTLSVGRWYGESEDWPHALYAVVKK